MENRRKFLIVGTGSMILHSITERLHKIEHAYDFIPVTESDPEKDIRAGIDIMKRMYEEAATYHINELSDVEVAIAELKKVKPEINTETIEKWCNQTGSNFLSALIEMKNLFLRFDPGYRLNQKLLYEVTDLKMPECIDPVSYDKESDMRPFYQRVASKGGKKNKRNRKW